MKRTNLVLDEKLLEEATRVLGLKTYSATVNKALEEAIRVPESARPASVHGHQPLAGRLGRNARRQPTPASPGKKGCALILLDTSVWIDLFRHRRGEILAQDYEDFVTCGPVLQEVVQGLRDLPASEIFRQGLLRVARLDDPMPAEAFLEAAEIYRSGRRRGYTIRSTVDCLIAAIAIRNSVPVWHKDRDYRLIARYTPLRAVTQIR